MCGFLWPALSQSAAVFFEASFGCFLDVSFLAWSRTCSSLVLYSDRWFVWLYLLFCCKGVWGVCACDLPVHISVHHYLNFFSICNTLSVVSPVFSSRSFSSSVVLFIYFFVIFLFLFLHFFFKILSSFILLRGDTPLCFCDVISYVMIFFLITMTTVLTVLLMMITM